MSCRSLCQKWEFFVEPEEKSQWTVLLRYLTISTNVCCYQTRCRRQYYLHLRNTAHAPVHGARNTAQQLLRKTLNFISPELWPQQARAQLSGHIEKSDHGERSLFISPFPSFRFSFSLLSPPLPSLHHLSFSLTSK